MFIFAFCRSSVILADDFAIVIFRADIFILMTSLKLILVLLRSLNILEIQVLTLLFLLHEVHKMPIMN